MTWEPKNKTDDDDDAVLTDSEDNKEKDDLSTDNRSDRVSEEARRGLDDTGELFSASPLPYYFFSSNTRCPAPPQRDGISDSTPPSDTVFAYPTSSTRFRKLRGSRL